MVLVDAYYLDREDKESNEKSIQILNKAINLVKVEKNRRQNSKIKFEYFGAMFNYKLAQIISDGVLNGKLKDDADLSYYKNLRSIVIIRKQNTIIHYK